jgi:hypothetical protein
MTPEKLAQMERCYRNWNGTAVMEGAFKELLVEVSFLTSERDALVRGDVHRMNRIEGLKAECAHWMQFVSSADQAQFPFNPEQ